MNDYNELDALKAEFVKRGGSLTSRQYRAAEARAAKQAQTDLDQQTAPPNPQAAQAIKRSLGWLAVGFTFIAVVCGVALVLIVVPAAEFVAVVLGLQAIYNNVIVNVLTAAALLVSVVFVSFMVHVRAAGVPPIPKRGLRQRAAGWWLWWGLPPNRDWIRAATPEALTSEQTQLQTMKAAFNAVKLAIYVTAVVGRLGRVLENVLSVPLGAVPRSLAENLTGYDVMGVLIMLMVVWAMFKGLEVGTAYVYIAFSYTAGRLDLGEAQAAVGADYYEQRYTDHLTTALQDLIINSQPMKPQNYEMPSTD